MEPGATLSFAQVVLQYFSPSRSPYYGIVAASATTLVLSCTGISGNVAWWEVTVPAAVVLVVCLALSFASRASFSNEEHEEQLRFVRAFSISAALLWMVFVVRNVENDRVAFYFGYFTCVIQALTFLLYAVARNYSVESYRQINLVQLALITTALLSAASAALIQRATTDPSSAESVRYWLVARGLYAVWGVCIVYWVRHLARLIHISVPIDPVPERRSASVVASSPIAPTGGGAPTPG